MAPMMGIVGVGTRLQRIGNIKIGMKGPVRKRKGAKDIRLPTKFDHFVVTTMELNPNEDWVVDKVAMEELGEKPTKIPVFVPYDRPDLICPHELAHWSASKRHCHGNREIAEETDEKTGKTTQIKCPCNKLNKECKPTAILNVMLELGGRIGGVHQLRTGSWNSLENILASLHLIRSITGGPIAGLPLTLTIQPKKVLVEGRKLTIHVVGLEFRANPQLTASAVQQMQEIATGVSHARLTTGQDMLAIEENAASLNRDLDTDESNWDEEFANTEGAGVDSKTAGKTADLKESLKKAEEKSEPTEAELAEQLRTEIGMLLEDPVLPPKTIKEWDAWLKKKLSLKGLQDGRDQMKEIIKKRTEASEDDAPSAEGTPEKEAPGDKEKSKGKTGRPSLLELTTNLNDLMGNAKEEGLVTEGEYEAVFNDADKNQNAKWLTDKHDEWKGIIEDRRKVREEESKDSDLKPGEQGHLA